MTVFLKFLAKHPGPASASLFGGATGGTAASGSFSGSGGGGLAPSGVGGDSWLVRRGEASTAEAFGEAGGVAFFLIERFPRTARRPNEGLRPVSSSLTPLVGLG